VVQGEVVGFPAHLVQNDQDQLVDMMGPPTSAPRCCDRRVPTSGPSVPAIGRWAA